MTIDNYPTIFRIYFIDCCETIEFKYLNKLFEWKIPKYRKQKTYKKKRKEGWNYYQWT